MENSTIIAIVIGILFVLWICAELYLRTAGEVKDDECTSTLSIPHIKNKDDLRLAINNGKDFTYDMADQAQVRKWHMEINCENSKNAEDFKLTAPPSGEDEPVHNINKRKKLYDTTKFTQAQYDIIIIEQNKRLANNKGLPRYSEQRVTAEEMVSNLNYRFGLNKSRPSYSNIWNGKVNRSELPYS